MSVVLPNGNGGSKSFISLATISEVTQQMPLIKGTTVDSNHSKSIVIGKTQKAPKRGTLQWPHELSEKLLKDRESLR